MEQTENATEGFHPPFIYVFVRVFLFGLLVGAALTFAVRITGMTAIGVVSWTFLQLICILYIWAVVSALVLIKMLAVRVCADGIWGMTFWGSRRFLPWDVLTDVRPLTLWPLRFWRLYPLDGTAPVWVPQFLKNREGFSASVLGKTELGNPLRTHLERG